MRLIQLTGALALTTLTLAAAPSFAQERYGRHDQDRVSSRRPTVSLSIVIGNTRGYDSRAYRGSAYGSRGSYGYGRSSNRRCAYDGRESYTSSRYDRGDRSRRSRCSDDRSYGSRDRGRNRYDDQDRSDRGSRRY